MSIELETGQIWVQANVPFYHIDDEGWGIGKRTVYDGFDHGERQVHDGEGRCTVEILEVMASEQFGQVVVFTKTYTTPDDEPMSVRCRKCRSAAGVKSYLSRYKFELAGDPE